MIYEARVRTPHLKPKNGWKSIDLRDAVGTLKMTATQPEDTALLRELNRMSIYGGELTIRDKNRRKRLVWGQKGMAD
jgi:hypothetical protein